MSAGTAITFKGIVVVQPNGERYLIIVVPIVLLVTNAVDGSMVATEGVTLVHKPPAMALLNVVEVPRQIFSLPVIGAKGFTDIAIIALHPVLSV